MNRSEFRSGRPRHLGAAEQHVMDYVWAHGPVSAENCRAGHTTAGRTFVYRAVEAPATVATRTVKHLIDRFCGGSAEALLLGMVNADVLTPKQLQRLAAKIAAEREKESK